ncbi:MAG TPA: hypothetical protein VFG30_08830, partial [Polyangiales bacterium]|nr:hypothetical protein [Polyangiales bacterium]
MTKPRALAELAGARGSGAVAGVLVAGVFCTSNNGDALCRVSSAGIGIGLGLRLGLGATSATGTRSSAAVAYREATVHAT